MSKNEQNPPRRRGRGTPEKPKDFKKSIGRLFKELASYRKFIGIALILAMLGAILSISAPNRLSKLTDEISNGLIPNTKNLEKITTYVQSEFKGEKVGEIISNILEPNISNDAINELLSSNEISNEDKLKFQTFMKESRGKSQEEMVFGILDLPKSITSIILPTSTYKSSTINTSDKLAFIKALQDLQSGNYKDVTIPSSISSVLFDEITIDDTKISSEDLSNFLITMSSVNKKTSQEDLYKKIDEMPLSIQKVIKPTMNMEKITKIALFLACIYILSALFTYIESIIMSVTSNKFARDLRKRISKKINVLPLSYFDKTSIGDILSRVTNDVDTIAQSMNQSLSSLVSAITLFIGTIIMMFYTNGVLAITAILASLIGFVFMFLVLGKSQKYFDARQRELGRLNGHVEEVYSGLNVIKVYNAEETVEKKFDEYNKNVYDANRKSQFLSGLMQPMMGFVGNLGYVAVCIVGALLTMNGKISFGVIIAFITYVRLFTSPLSQIAQGINMMQSTAAAGERVFEFLDEKEMEKETPKYHLANKDAKGAIEFKNVTFTYDGNDKPTIKNFTAKVKPGQKIAIVGPTGAGKTTMVNLLMKFYNIDSGDIIIDGHSIKDLSRENIHDLFTMVLQDTWLFNGTVKENIVYNRENVPDEKVEEVCKVVGIDHFVKSLPNSYDTVLDSNSGISAGEKQLLTIARGMIEDAPFLILDEATSNVDTRTEELVQAAMDKLMENRTSFIIAHRLSTIKNSDLILVMKDGNIIEQGNHDELMKQGGFYKDLYNSQFMN